MFYLTFAKEPCRDQPVQIMRTVVPRFGTGARLRAGLWLINPHVIIYEWQEILPVAILSLNPLHRDIVKYVMNQPGKRRPSYKHAQTTWNLDRDQFDAELRYAYRAIRQYLRRFGLTNSRELESE